MDGTYIIKGKYIAAISCDAFELLHGEHECFSFTYTDGKAYISGPGSYQEQSLRCKDVVSLANFISKETQINYEAAVGLAELLRYSFAYIEAVIM